MSEDDSELFIKSLKRNLFTFKKPSNVKSILDINIKRIIPFISSALWEKFLKEEIIVSIDYLDSENNKINYQYQQSDFSTCFNGYSNKVSDDFINTTPILVYNSIIDKKKMFSGEEHTTKIEIELLSELIYCYEDYGYDGTRYWSFSNKKDTLLEGITLYYDNQKWEKEWEKDKKWHKKIALNFNKSSLEYYANKYLEVLRKNHNIKNLDLQSTLLNGIEFYKISYQQFDKDLNKYIQCNLYCQKGLDYYYRILTITGLDDLSYVEALESVVSSFKEVETIYK